MHAPTEKHLGRFQTLAIIKKNCCEYLCARFCVTLTLACGYGNQQARIMHLVFQDTAQLSSKVLGHFALPPVMDKNS